MNPHLYAEAIAAAIRLHDFLRSNAGENADWPIQISSTESGALEELDRLLKEFRQRVMGIHESIELIKP